MMSTSSDVLIFYFYCIITQRHIYTGTCHCCSKDRYWFLNFWHLTWQMMINYWWNLLEIYKRWEKKGKILITWITALKAGLCDLYFIQIYICMHDSDCWYSWLFVFGTGFSSHTHIDTGMSVKCVFPLQTVIQTSSTLTGTASSWPPGFSLAWPGSPCSSTTPSTSWSGSTPTSDNGGVGGSRRRVLAMQRAKTQTLKYKMKTASKSLLMSSNI